MSDVSLSRDEAMERARLLSVTSYDVELVLSTESTLRSRSTVVFECREPGAGTFVELAGATTATARLNGEPLAPDAFVGNRITLQGLREHNELVVDATLPCVTSGDGMHRYVDPADGATYLSAFCGSDLAQRVFGCCDQPDLKATIALTVTAPADWTVLANGRPTGVPAEVRTFSTTRPISTYLFVVCAGPWHSVTWEHAGLPFGWHARRSLAGALDRDAEELKRVTAQCFDHYTDAFDEPYAFDSYDQVMAPGLNWGALETPGCVTFRDELLPAGGASDAQREERAMVVAHEMAHMWFGDLVTLRWWEDIWLNESFADYMGFQVANTAAGFASTWTGFTLSREPLGYAADERRSTHPVAPLAASVVDTDAGFANTDMITYAKGNAVLRQLVTWLGEETFLRGVNRFLTAHRFGNADLTDFLEALDEVTDREVRPWAEAWLRTTGFDTLVVRREGREGTVPALTRSGSRPHRTRVTAYAPGASGLVEQGSRMVDVADEEIRFEEWAGLVVLPNAHDETFARVRTDPQSWAALAAGVGGLGDQERAVVWATAFDLVAQAELAPVDLLHLVGDQLATERSPAIWEAVVGQTLRVVLPRYLVHDQLLLARSVLTEVAAATAAATSSLRLAATRTLATCASSTDLLLGWLDAERTDTGLEVDSELRWRVLTRLAELGEVDADRIDGEAAADRSSQAETGAARARAAIPTRQAKEDAWSVFSAPDVGNRVFRAVADGLWVPEQADLVAPYVDRYLAEAPAWAERRGQGFSRVLGHAFPAHAATPEALTGLATALAGSLPTVLRRAWEDERDDLEAAAAVRSRWS
ncbi:MAG: aminopeptidase N [Marmoricola sp.]